MNSLSDFLRCTVALMLVVALCGVSSASTPKSFSKRIPVRIVFDKPHVELGLNRTIEVRAKVLDRRGRRISNASLAWDIPESARDSIEVRPLDKLAGTVLIVLGQVNRTGPITVQARSGPATNNLIVNIQVPAATEIVFPPPEGNKVKLPVRAHKTLRAYVLDAQGNRLASAQVGWSLADPDHEAFVLVGPNVNKAGVNEVEISWLGGKADLKTPTEVKLVARSGGARGIVTIDYEAPKPEATKITLEPKEITIRPGESIDVQVTVRSVEDDRILKVEPEAEIADATARKFIRALVMPDNKTISVIGSYGEENSPPPDFLNTALVVKAGSGIATIPVVYRRNAATVDWDILPTNIVGDNYGRTIRNDYYCIEVRIQNNSGADLALAGLGFQHNGVTRPNTSYGTVHGSLARRKLTHPRTMTLAIIDGLGTLMTGFNPFFHDLNHAKNYSQFIDILSNPLAKGLDRAWMDSYPDELARLEHDALQDEKTIPNGQIFKTKIFFPKRALFKNHDPRREDPIEVRKELGTLWVLGYKFQRGPVRTIAGTP